MDFVKPDPSDSHVISVNSVGISSIAPCFPVLDFMERLSAIALAHAMTFDEAIQYYDRVAKYLELETDSADGELSV